MHVEGTIEELKINKEVLAPLLVLMKDNKQLLPNIDRLIQSIDVLYTSSKNHRDLEHCYQQAWALRRLIQKLKSFTYRDLPPTEAYLALFVFAQWSVI